MDRASEKRKVTAIRQEVEALLSEQGVELQLADNPRAEAAVRNQHPELYLWLIIRNLARAIGNQQPVTAEQLRQVEGVGPATAQRIAESLGF